MTRMLFPTAVILPCSSGVLTPKAFSGSPPQPSLGSELQLRHNGSLFGPASAAEELVLLPRLISIRLPPACGETRFSLAAGAPGKTTRTLFTWAAPPQQEQQGWATQERLSAPIVGHPSRKLYD